MIIFIIATHEAETKSVNSQMANAAAASLQNAFLQSARPLPFSINNILHQVRIVLLPS